MNQGSHGPVGSSPWLALLLLWSSLLLLAGSLQIWRSHTDGHTLSEDLCSSLAPKTSLSGAQVPE